MILQCSSGPRKPFKFDFPSSLNVLYFTRYDVLHSSFQGCRLVTMWGHVCGRMCLSSSSTLSSADRRCANNTHNLYMLLMSNFLGQKFDRVKVIHLYINIHIYIYIYIPTWLLRNEEDCCTTSYEGHKCISHHWNYYNPSAAAIVTPIIMKAGLEQSNLQNYRPVSSLPSVSKLAARIVCDYLVEHLSKNDLYQSACKKGHRISTALPKVKGDI